MATVKFIEANGTEHVVTVQGEISAMKAAVLNGVPGIDGDCGGSAACATCHVYVDPSWISKTGAAEDETEKTMLEFTSIATENSRLACQITITEALDGLVLHLPDQQF